VYFTALFDLFLFGIAQKVSVDHFPGLIANCFNILIQCRLFAPFVCNSDMAEPPLALRFNDMKGQLFICEPKKNFDNGTSQHPISAQALCSSTLNFGLAFVQTLQKTIADDTVCINDAADYFQLLALSMIKNMGHQGYLFLPIFAHFVIECLDTFNILQNEKHYYIKMRFLFIFK
jgi:hypothetical protein